MQTSSVKSFFPFLFLISSKNKFFHLKIFFQLNSPNRILLLHMSLVCMALSFLYLWALINNSIIPSYLKEPGDTPSSLAITTVTIASSSSFHSSSTTVSPSNTTKSDEIGSVSSFNDLLIHLLQPIGLWTISCINFDRYYAICSPLHYNTLLTTKKVKKIIKLI